MGSSYEYALGLTSQFYYCGLPLRLDSYSKCQYGCLYCFAKARGGNFDPSRLKFLDTRWLSRKLERAATNVGTSPLDEMIRRRIPIHYGGMTDPFPRYEAQRRVTLEAIRVLHGRNYPTVLSTKGTLFSEDNYLSLLVSGSFVVQVSVSTSSEQLHRKINIGAPSLKSLFSAIRTASTAGVPTVCRIQPALPNRSSDVNELIDMAAASGTRHVAVEHLKIGMERGAAGTTDLSQALGYDVVSFFRASGAKRAGREWLLPLDMRLPPMLDFRRRVRSKGMTFGAADTDLLHLSDGNCCCNATDLLLPHSSPYRFTISEAIKRASSDGRVTFSSISKEWRPVGSIGRYINSKCRNGIGVEENFRYAWNNGSHGPTPGNFWGVRAIDELDSDGMALFEISNDAMNAMNQ